MGSCIVSLCKYNYNIWFCNGFEKNLAFHPATFLLQKSCHSLGTTQDFSKEKSCQTPRLVPHFYRATPGDWATVAPSEYLDFWTISNGLSPEPYLLRICNGLYHTCSQDTNENRKSECKAFNCLENFGPLSKGPYSTSFKTQKESN